MIAASAGLPSAFALALAREIEMRIFCKHQTHLDIKFIHGHFLIAPIPKPDVVDIPCDSDLYSKVTTE